MACQTHRRSRGRKTYSAGHGYSERAPYPGVRTTKKVCDDLDMTIPAAQRQVSERREHRFESRKRHTQSLTSVVDWAIVSRRGEELSGASCIVLSLLTLSLPRSNLLRLPHLPTTRQASSHTLLRNLPSEKAPPQISDIHPGSKPSPNEPAFRITLFYSSDS